MPGVFAVGDVRSGSVKRVGGAIGEGAQVVAALHGFLETGNPGRRRRDAFLRDGRGVSDDSEGLQPPQRHSGPSRRARSAVRNA